MSKVNGTWGEDYGFRPVCTFPAVDPTFEIWMLLILWISLSSTILEFLFLGTCLPSEPLPLLAALPVHFHTSHNIFDKQRLMILTYENIPESSDQILVWLDGFSDPLAPDLSCCAPETVRDSVWPCTLAASAGNSEVLPSCSCDESIVASTSVALKFDIAPSSSPYLGVSKIGLLKIAGCSNNKLKATTSSVFIK